ncbi:DUF3618 domain-containing protein [Micromonospora globbae]|jgi:hypothetical protein|uniref:DUF3618 domain-containing protein n=1 Tax=Micromonospora globbae TaxID=1894969 RepID=A0A420EZ36_9ACTN|nr:DUF3618 domain-containing protein [Micromonospora globbae]RKF25963.1 DUF3618 domain-containing protein [Micromonospora globbae]WTF85859.1 DUF3618 domain-containing protein [Micromonospora globbae]
MSTDPDRIRQQIEYTRGELSTNVDALSDKVNPRRIASDRVGQARGMLTRMKEKVMGTSSHMSDAAGQKMSSAAGSVQHMGEQAGHRMSSAAGSVQHMGEHAGERMSHAADSARQQARSIGHQSREQAQGNPMTAGLLAFGAGVLVSALMPPSRRERQWAGQAREMVGQHAGDLRHQAGQFGQQLTAGMRGPAQEAARSVGSTAARGAAAVAEEGRSAAQHVRGETQEAVGEVRRG